MTVQDYRVGDLPFRRGLFHPPYWDKPPDDWYAHVQPSSTLYGNGIVGDMVVYMAYNPVNSTIRHIDGLGEVVVRDVRNVERSSHDFGKRHSIEYGEIIGRFGFYPPQYREAHGGAPETPAWQEASKLAQGFAWGYVEGGE